MRKLDDLPIDVIETISRPVYSETARLNRRATPVQNCVSPVYARVR
jgi:hypothetical protein